MKILVIGGTSTIANSCCEIWAKDRNEIFLVARNQRELEKVGKNLELLGATIYSKAIDFDNHTNILELFDEVIAQLKSVDIILICFGLLPNQEECENDLNILSQEININAFATLTFANISAKILEQQGKGTLAIVSSVAGDRGRSSNYVYGSCKAMVSSFSSGLRQKFSNSNINVLTIKPGFVKTKMTENIDKNFLWVESSIVAKDITKAIRTKKSILYTPRFWRLIMLIIKIIPESLYKRLSL